MKKRSLMVVVAVLVALMLPGFAFASGLYGNEANSGSFSGAAAGAAAYGGNLNSYSSSPIMLPIIPGVNFPVTPNEFINDSHDGNYVLIKNMIPSGFCITKAQAVAMLTPVGKQSWYKSGPGVATTFHSIAGTQDLKNVPDNAQITFVYEGGAPAGLTLQGGDVARITNGEDDSWSLIGQLALDALSIPGCTQVVLTGEGAQKFTNVSALGLSLGVTWITISERSDAATGGGGTAGIGYTKGKAQRLANPWIQASMFGTTPAPAPAAKKK